MLKNVMKRWELIFKALSNINRLKIIKMLWSGESINVSDIAKKLDISFAGTSRHLIILRNFEVLQSEGKENHVNYYINSKIPKDFELVIKTILK